MTPETRERVLAAMQQLSYHPNANALRLRQLRSNTIGFTILDPSPRFLADAFTVEVLSGAAEVLREHGFHLLLQGLDPSGPTQAANVAAPLQMRQADGLVLMPSGPLDAWRETIVELGKTGCPVVLVQVAVPELDEPSPRITSMRADDFGGGRSCGTLLVQLGHRRIAFLTTRASWPAVESRLEGAGEALANAGLAPATRILAADWTVADGRDAVARYLAETPPAERPTAIMAANDVLAAGALAAIRETGLSVPRDISVAGFDDLDLALVVSPTLTTVAVPGYEVGRRAAEVVVEQLEASEPIAPSQVLETKLVLRESTAPPPA